MKTRSCNDFLICFFLLLSIFVNLSEGLKIQYIPSNLLFILFPCVSPSQFSSTFLVERNLATFDSFNVNIDPKISQCKIGYAPTNGVCGPDSNINHYSSLRCRPGFILSGTACVSTPGPVACRKNFVWSSSTKKCIFYGDGVPTPSASTSAKATMSTTASPTVSTSGSSSTSPTPSRSGSATPTLSLSSSPTASPSDTVTTSPTVSASGSSSTSPTPSRSGSATPTLSLSSSPTASPSVTFSSTTSVSSTVSTSTSQTALPSNPSISALPSTTSAASSSSSMSSVPSSSSAATNSATATSSSTSSSTTSGTSTSTYRAPDLSSSSPSPRPIVNVAFTLSNVQLSLFASGSNEQILTALINAVASAVGAAPSFVSIRRVRDFTYPLTPTVIWMNPKFSGDYFSSRRLVDTRDSSSFYRNLQSMGSVSIDVQISLQSNTAAATLSAQLVKSASKLAADVVQSLVNQGSPLSTAQITATVEIYDGTTSNESEKSSSPSSNGLVIPIAVGVVVIAAIAIGYTYYRVKKRSASKVAPLVDASGEDTVSERIGSSTSTSDTTSTSSNWSVTSRTTDSRVTVAKVMADHENDEADKADNLETVKAIQEASLQERIAQREVMKARVARKKAEEYKALKDKGIHLPGTVLDV
jgi:hypothetical protein